MKRVGHEKSEECSSGLGARSRLHVLQAARHFQPIQFMSGYAAPAVLLGQQSALKFGDPIKEWGDPGVP